MTDHYEMPHRRADECPHAGVGKACRPCRVRFVATPITPDERATLRALADAATPGPWRRDWYAGVVEPKSRLMTAHEGYNHSLAEYLTETDARFIAAARTDVPRLLDALDTAEAEVARLHDTIARAWDEGAEAGRLNTYEHRPGREMHNPYREGDST